MSNNQQITIKIRRSTHAELVKSLRIGRQKHGEQLALQDWLQMVITAGIAAQSRRSGGKKTKTR